MMSRPARTWFFATLFAAIGFVVGGSVVLYLGFRIPNRPPSPPGLGYCGNSVLGEVLRRWVAAVLWAPVAAIACGLGAALLGGILDCVLGRRWARREGKATTDALLRLIDDPDPDVRLNAFEALHAFAPGQVPESAVAQLLNDANQRKKGVAASAAGRSTQ
jgi:hypothetical protein